MSHFVNINLKEVSTCNYLDFTGTVEEVGAVVPISPPELRCLEDNWYWYVSSLSAWGQRFSLASPSRWEAIVNVFVVSRWSARLKSSTVAAEVFYATSDRCGCRCYIMLGGLRTLLVSSRGLHMIYRILFYRKQATVDATSDIMEYQSNLSPDPTYITIVRRFIHSPRSTLWIVRKKIQNYFTAVYATCP